MANRVHAGMFIAAVAAGTLGCPDDPAPPTDAGMDVGDVPGDRPMTDTGGDTNPPTDVTDGGGMCPSVAFTALQMDQVLGVANDSNQNCADGFSTNVQVATNAQIGTMLELMVNTRVAGTVRVAGPSVLFSNVTLDTGSPSTLSVRIAGTTAACGSVTVRVNCNTPRCQITSPMRSTLNRADGAPGAMAFAVDFTVSTDIEDGRTVQLTESSQPTPLTAMVMGGMATFRSVALVPDGEHRVRATCTNAAGNIGTSAESTFTVDATPPTVTISSPMSGSTIGVSSDANTMRDGVQFRVCAQSNAAGQRLCAAVGSGMPDDPAGCATVPASATMDSCVEVTCPTGSAPFDVNVNASDVAGNRTVTTLTGVRCQSSLPSVRVVAPAAYTMGMDGTILNAMRDENPMVAGLQATIVACSDRSAGMARLLVNGAAVGMPAALAPTTMGDPCAALGMGFSGIVRFPGVTVPETTPERANSTDPQPTTPAVTVEVTDSASDVGLSPAVTLYVDSRAPDVSIVGCNRVVTLGAGTSATTDIDVLSSSFPVVLTLRHGADTPTVLTASGPSFPGRARFPAVPLLPGETTLSATAADPAGNVGSAPAMGAMCNITVGNPPRLDFVSPTAAQIFSRTGDADPAMAGFQSVTIRLTSDAPAGTVVSLVVGSDAPRMAPVAADGTVSFGPLTLPEGAAVRLAATTADVAGRGVGSASVTVVVDTTIPTNASDLTITVPPATRRVGTLRLAFTNGSDPVIGGSPVAITRYEVRYGNAPITETNFATALLASNSVPGGTPGSMSTYDIQRARLGISYYVGIRGYDAAGNPSAIVNAGPVALNVLVDRVVSMPGGSAAAISIGRIITGGFDTNGDMLADVVSATGIGYVRVLFGSAMGVTGASYADIVGPTSAAAGFGTAAASVGDVNGDGLGDVLVGAGASRNAYLYFGRRTWPTAPASLGPTDANVTFNAGATDLVGSSFGQVVTRIGDFNGDGISDFSISAPGPNLSDTTSVQPGVVYVFFGRPMGTAWPATLTSDDANVVIRYDVPRGGFGGNVVGIGRALGGDSRDDIAILATAVDATESTLGLSARRGRVLVFAGRAAATQVTLTPTDRSFEVIGESTTARLSSMGGVGDIDGDGRSDLAVGNGNGNGVVRLFYGNAAGTSFTSGASIPGPAGTFGSVIASITDSSVLHPTLLLPGANAADLVFGEISHMGSTQPWVYAYIGRSAAAWGTTANSNNAEYTLISEGVPGTTGTQPISSLNWVGDVDGDLQPDLAFGQFTSAATTAGRVYIVR